MSDHERAHDRAGADGEPEVILKRLERVEELVMFSDHTADQLGEQMAVLSKALDTLSRRIAALEQRFQSLTPPPPTDPTGSSPIDDPPPE